MPENKFDQLKQIIDRLHSKEGCMWDRQQTHKSLIPYLKEETAEVIQAIKKEDDENLTEELADLLLQIFFHAKIAEKQGKFAIEDVLETLAQKLVRRHPHVFGDVKVKSVEEILVNWEKIKHIEKQDKKLS